LLLRARFFLGARPEENEMRSLNTNELTAVSGGTNPHLTTISVTTNPGGVVNKSSNNNPNAITTTITFKTTGKPA
jgi:hypothetical protein